MRERSSAALRRPRTPRLQLTYITSGGSRHNAIDSVQDPIVNMKFIAVVLFAILALARAQFGGFGHYSQFGFGAGLDAPLQVARDPRANTGPVVFPPAPPDNGETSGVVVGASGFGFVPPNGPSRQSFFNYY